MKTPFPSLALMGALLLFSLVSRAENWPRFRGPNGQGVSSETGIPIAWSQNKNVAWRTEIPGKSWSSPIVWEDHVFLTSATEDGASCRVIAVDRISGMILWNREVFRQETRRKERRNSYATPTAVTDGQRVYATFADGGVAALDFQGNVIWTNLDYKFYSQHGLGASPILYRDRLIIVHDGSSEGPDTKVGWQVPWDKSYVLALDTSDGSELWKTSRGMSRISHGTPAIWEREDGKDQIVSEAGDVIQGYDPISGERLWSGEVIGEGKVPSVTLGDGLVFTAGGWGGNETTKAFRLGGAGQLGESRLVWEQRQSMPKVPSLIYVEPYVYGVTDGGIAICMDSQTGDLLWQERIEGSHGASPVSAEGRLYFTSDQGVTTVVPARPEFQLLAENNIDESVQATPAISQGSLFIRTETALLRIEAGGFQSIFDGETLDGWHVSAETGHSRASQNQSGGDWKVVDGAITGSQDIPGNGGILITDEPYGDFEVSLEMNNDYGPDSGLFLRSTEDGKAWQAMIDYHANGNLMGIYGEGLGGRPHVRNYSFLEDVTDITDTPTGEPPIALPVLPDSWPYFWRHGQWNELRARIVGNPPHITTWINGVKIMEWKETEIRHPDTGGIALQVHGGGDHTNEYVRYRNIRVKKLN